MNIACEACGATNRDTASFCNNCGRPLPAKTTTGKLAAHALLNGRYEIAEVTGRGNMGAVYRAYDFQSDRTVAIKEMSDTALGAGQRSHAVDQFRREALLLQALNHPNLVRVTDVFTEERRHYLVMDFVEGRPLSELARRARIPEKQVHNWALQLCDALAFLHSRQPSVIFRDLKPENIMLVESTDQIKLIDFGIARFFDPAKERDTLAIGTRGFMAPEALQGQTDPRSDLYSLGITLHTLLTGFDPAADPWHLPLVNTLVPGVSEEMTEIVAHAVQLDPDGRFQTAAEFARALGGEVSAVEEVAAPSAPVAARVTSARPVRFNGREQVTGLEQLTGLCLSHWEAAVNHLRAGELEVWLEHLGEKELARYARELRQQAGADMNVQLKAWLEGTGKVKPPLLTTSPPILNLGAVGIATPCITRLRIRNTGPGWLVGRIDPDAPWLAPEQTTFSGNDQVLRIRVYADRLPQLATTTGSLHIRSNGGETSIPVRLMPVPGAAAGAQQASPPQWAAGVLSVLAVAGGAWLAVQLAERWGLVSGFDIRAWLAHPAGVAILLLVTLCLSLAALIGSISQWEVLVSDAPPAQWGRSALWVAGLTLIMLLLAAAIVSYAFWPLLLRFKQEFGLVPHQLAALLPLITGAVVAWGAAGGLGARRGITISVSRAAPILILWGILILAGAAGGFALGGLVHEARPLGLDPDLWWRIVVAGILIGGAAGYALARLLGFGPAGALSNLAHAGPATSPEALLTSPAKARWPLAVGLAVIVGVAIAGLALLPGRTERDTTLPPLPSGATRVNGMALWGTQPVPRANIMASEVVTGTTRPARVETMADAKGQFTLAIPAPGAYELLAYWPDSVGAGCVFPKTVNVAAEPGLNIGVLTLAKRADLMKISPGEVLTNTVPELNWQSYPGVYAYDLVVTDVSTEQPVLTENTPATRFTATTALEPGMQYQWSLTGFARPGMPLVCDDGWFQTQP